MLYLFCTVLNSRVVFHRIHVPYSINIPETFLLPYLCTGSYLFPAPWHSSENVAAIMEAKHNTYNQTKDCLRKQRRWTQLRMRLFLVNFLVFSTRFQALSDCGFHLLYRARELLRAVMMLHMPLQHQCPP